VENPSARDEPVSTIMGEPFPVVPASLHLDHLTSYLEGDTGAVLVERDAGYTVVTKSDLISALARMGRNGNGAS
jgi:cystathionine beta-synthase